MPTEPAPAFPVSRFQPSMARDNGRSTNGNSTNPASSANPVNPVVPTQKVLPNTSTSSSLTPPAGARKNNKKLFKKKTPVPVVHRQVEEEDDDSLDLDLDDSSLSFDLNYESNLATPSIPESHRLSSGRVAASVKDAPGERLLFGKMIPPSAAPASTSHQPSVVHPTSSASTTSSPFGKPGNPSPLVATVVQEAVQRSHPLAVSSQPAVAPLTMTTTAAGKHKISDLHSE